jgi:hypothetical protein
MPDTHKDDNTHSFADAWLQQDSQQQQAAH